MASLCPFVVLLAAASVMLRTGCAQYSSDQCSWRGSGLTHETHVRDVEQVYLRCSQGSLDWLYPTGAIIVNLRPNTQPRGGTHAHLHACIKPRASSRGATLYVERGGQLRLLLSEEDQRQGKVRCFSLQEGALFVEASAAQDISRRITSLQYELVSADAGGDQPYSHTAACRPCTDDEILMAVCTSDFVGRGRIEAVEEEPGEERVSVAVALTRLFRQKSGVFSAVGGRRGLAPWAGRVRTGLGCGVRRGTGGDDFLFTGSVRFGEAWLGCAPRYAHFLRVYGHARRSGTNPCHIDTD